MPLLYLFGSTTFYNLTKEVAAAATLEFESDSTTTVANALTLRGAAGQRLYPNPLPLGGVGR